MEAGDGCTEIPVISGQVSLIGAGDGELWEMGSSKKKYVEGAIDMLYSGHDKREESIMFLLLYNCKGYSSFVDEVIYFVQNLCTYEPVTGILYCHIRQDTTDFTVNPCSEDRKPC